MPEELEKEDQETAESDLMVSFPCTPAMSSNDRASLPPAQYIPVPVKSRSTSRLYLRTHPKLVPSTMAHPCVCARDGNLPPSILVPAPKHTYNPYKQNAGCRSCVITHSENLALKHLLFAPLHPFFAQLYTIPPLVGTSATECPREPP